MMAAPPPLALNAQLRWDVVTQLLPADARRVLEIGTGQGAVAARLARSYPDFVGVEPDPLAWHVAAARVGSFGHVLNRHVEELEAHEVFDLVCAFEVLEHIEDDASVLRGWVSRLRPGGVLVLSTPAWARRMASHDHQVGHYRRYDPDQMLRLMGQAGLTDVVVRPYGGIAGFALEATRNAIARRRATPHQDATMRDRTAASGRYLQPRDGLTGAALVAAGLPLRALSRLSGPRGPGLVARGTRS